MRLPTGRTDIWNLAREEVGATLTEYVAAIEFSPDGAYIIITLNEEGIDGETYVPERRQLRHVASNLVLAEWQDHFDQRLYYSEDLETLEVTEDGSMINIRGFATFKIDPTSLK